MKYTVTIFNNAVTANRGMGGVDKKYDRMIDANTEDELFTALALLKQAHLGNLCGAEKFSMLSSYVASKLIKSILKVIKNNEEGYDFDEVQDSLNLFRAIVNCTDIKSYFEDINGEGWDGGWMSYTKVTDKDGNVIFEDGGWDDEDDDEDWLDDDDYEDDEDDEDW